jgi:acetyl-CoA C-acetyltransferase
MGETAEHVATQWNISREEQDIFAFQSQQKYFSALEAGKWEDEIVAVEMINDRLISWFSQDEPPRQTSLDTLAALKPVFKKDGTVTAGNCSGINDGAAAVLVASEEAVKLFGLQPLARVVSMGVAGVHPAIMGIGPVPSTDKALQRAGLTVNDLDLVEMNESFASQALACIKELQLDPAKVNVNGGCIAIGHPLGCSGTRIIASLLHEMRRSELKYGLASMCIGVGQGTTMIFEGV